MPRKPEIENRNDDARAELIAEVFNNAVMRWWARQDSNLQPDRYERPALTIELQARRHASRIWRIGNR